MWLHIVSYFNFQHTLEKTAEFVSLQPLLLCKTAQSESETFDFSMDYRMKKIFDSKSSVDEGSNVAKYLENVAWHRMVQKPKSALPIDSKCIAWIAVRQMWWCITMQCGDALQANWDAAYKVFSME